ncbi:hypothetical protein EV363DRAFT_1379501 [Boletus edulis]|uniref:Uncharacterized protein n=1 Tax=Boletus edulis BED1 TaxID=1328754 RepID=A0AAD4G4F2_BOLED|nr:hypothetical protein EV363DRAFT_1379501 [Boletus edulis]KAF8414589.1 hypothetical protein L210DRAFT_3591524 [Boletus edulis BED1]
MPAFRTRDTPSQCKSYRSSSSQDPDLTGTIQPPSLAIVSPTLRAISFPFNQTETSPYASPTSSLFEPDPRKLALSQQWKPLSPEERLYWEELAKQKEEGAQADVPQLRLSIPEKQGSQGKEGEVWR